MRNMLLGHASKAKSSGRGDKKLSSGRRLLVFLSSFPLWLRRKRWDAVSMNGALVRRAPPCDNWLGARGNSVHKVQVSEGSRKPGGAGRLWGRL